MKKIYDDATQLIGNTPLVRLNRIKQAYRLPAHLLAKVEAFNPGGSAKDRVALAMIQAAEQQGLLAPGAMIVEPTSGNTGVGLAWVGAVKGYRVVLTMPESMSIERRKLAAAYGAQVVLTPASKGMAGAIAAAQRIVDENPGAFMPLQFENPANPAIHCATTAAEIWRDTDGAIDIFVAGVGTGGTISGVAQGLKRLKPDIKVVAVEPANSAVLSGQKPGAHKIQGIGAGFIPANFNPDVVDQIIAINDDDAIATARAVAVTEGLLVGISAGAALHAAINLAGCADNVGKTIVTLLPDTGERYLSVW